MREITPNIGFYQEIREFLPVNLQNMVDLIPEDLATKTGDSLHILCMPSPQMRSFKIMFWKVLDASIVKNQQLMAEEAACGYPLNTYRTFTNNAVKVAWLLCKDIAYDITAQTYLNDILKKFAPIINKEIVNVHGEIDYKLFDANIKLFAMLDKRLHGQYVQKIEEKSIRLTGKEAADAVTKKASYDVQIADMKAKLEQAGNAGGQGFTQLINGDDKDVESSDEGPTS